MGFAEAAWCFFDLGPPLLRYPFTYYFFFFEGRFTAPPCPKENYYLVWLCHRGVQGHMATCGTKLVVFIAMFWFEIVGELLLSLLFWIVCVWTNQKNSGWTSVDRSTKATLSTYNTWIHVSRLQKIYHFQSLKLWLTTEPLTVEAADMQQGRDLMLDM